MRRCRVAPALATFLVLAAAGPGLAQADFDDGFDHLPLVGRWEWSVPKPGPTISLTDHPGFLRLTLPQAKEGFNHWSNIGADKAPLLLAKAPSADERFSVETHIKLVSYAPDSSFHIGLVVAMSKRYLLAWGPFFSPLLGDPKERPQVWGEPTGLGRFVMDRGEGGDVYLRIEGEPAAGTYTMSLRRDPAAPWQRAGVWHCFWPPQYVGIMGKTFGDGGPVVADIDYFRLDLHPPLALKPAPASISVDCAAPGPKLNPMRFGHFIEHLSNCIDGGLWAEMLLNRKFTGKVGANGAVEGWETFGLRDGATIARDNDRYYCPAQSQRITMTKPGAPVGLVQGGLTLQPGVKYQVRLVAGQQGLTGPVVVGLRAGDKTVAQAEVRDIGAEWTEKRLELAGPATRTPAALFIATTTPGTVWLGAISLMPADNMDGFRGDVVRALREIKPPVIRWPGGNFVSGYDWRDGIGERDRRPPRWNRAWNQWEWNDVGTHEFLRLCELLGATPYITVNAGEGNAVDAAAWVEYCNGAPRTQWGAVRARNGHSQPWKVPIWSIGNEMWGDWQLGHLTATQYGLKAVEFARAMRAVDPGIKLIGDGVDADAFGGWNREFCQIAGKYLDWLSVHYYLEVNDFQDPVLNYSVVMGAPRNVERMLGYTADLASRAAGKPLPVAFDEWNIPHPFFPASLRDGLFACSLFNSLNRLGDRATMANLALMVNVMGIVNANPDGVERTGTHRAFGLYANNSGSIAVPVTLANNPAVDLPNAAGCPVLDASATLSEDRKTLYVAVVNRNPTRETAAGLELAGFNAKDTVGVRTLEAEKVNTVNSLAKPDGIRLTAKEVPLQEALRYAFPPHSATVLVFGRK